jgi:threonine dehydratase
MQNSGSVGDIRAARAFLEPYLHRTPLWKSATLSKMLGRSVSLKLELLQKTGSYKPRGMLWAVQNLSPEQRERGVITFSAGNAAQGLAWAGAQLGVKTYVVMAAAANPTKIEATRGYGAEVLLHGTPPEAATFCAQTAEERGLTFVSSYDDEALMTGHASLGLEILEDRPGTTDIFVGIGGGGMSGGLVKAIEETGSTARLFGVEPEGAAAMSQSLATGSAVKLDRVSTIADGLAAPSAGVRCLELIERRFEEVLVLPDDAILSAMRFLMQRSKVMAEPAGAAALAGLFAHAERGTLGDEVVCVVSGGNVDLALLKQWL